MGEPTRQLAANWVGSLRSPTVGRRSLLARPDTLLQGTVRSDQPSGAEPSGAVGATGPPPRWRPDPRRGRDRWPSPGQRPPRAQCEATGSPPRAPEMLA